MFCCHYYFVRVTSNEHNGRNYVMSSTWDSVPLKRIDPSNVVQLTWTIQRPCSRQSVSHSYFVYHCCPLHPQHTRHSVSNVTNQLKQPCAHKMHHMTKSVKHLIPRLNPLRLFSCDKQCTAACALVDTPSPDAVKSSKQEFLPIWFCLAEYVIYCVLD